MTIGEHKTNKDTLLSIWDYSGVLGNGKVINKLCVGKYLENAKPKGFEAFIVVDQDNVIHINKKNVEELGFKLSITD